MKNVKSTRKSVQVSGQAARRSAFFVATILSLLIGGLSSAGAAPLACKFQKTVDDFNFRHLPSEIVGWVNCMPADEDLNLLYVAKLASTDSAAVQTWFRGYEKIMVPGLVSSKVVEKSAGNGGTWLEIESSREFGKVTHYVFTARAVDGTSFAFVYTDSEEHARKIRAKITSLRSVLEKTNYISAINAALP